MATLQESVIEAHIYSNDKNHDSIRVHVHVLEDHVQLIEHLRKVDKQGYCGSLLLSMYI